MKKLCVLYGNCQMDGLAHFLRKTRMAEEYDMTVHHNWQIMMGEQLLSPLLEELREARLFIYQPCSGYMARGGAVTVQSTKEMITDFLGDAPSISFAYQFNTGFFPFIKIGQGWDGWIAPTDMKEQAKKAVVLGQRGGMVIDFYADKFQYDCARRFVQCLAEQARREETTDIKMVPWILQNYRKFRLFLTVNHPTSALFIQLAAQVIDRIYPITESVAAPYHLAVNENDANMNGVAPVHPAVVRELGLEYQPTDGSIEYYRDLLEQMIKELR